MSFLQKIKNNWFRVHKKTFLNLSMHNLTGFLLAASPKLTDTFFSKTLIYICAHNHTGTLGLVINRHTATVSSHEIFEKYLNISIVPTNIPPIRLYEGGPIEKNKAFLLHTSDYRNKNTFVFRNGISISSTEDVLYDLLKKQAPDKMLLIFGYARWTPKQLELELKKNTWLVLPATQELVFSDETYFLWEKSLRTFGIDPALITEEITHA